MEEAFYMNLRKDTDKECKYGRKNLKTADMMRIKSKIQNQVKEIIRIPDKNSNKNS